jgi:hypothetical protein
MPRSASANDPKWELELLALTQGLIVAGAKVKLIGQLTGVAQRRAKSLHRTLLGAAPPAGPVARGNARFFARPNAHTSAAWSVQCAIFLGCFERIEMIAQTPLHRGWQLLAAYRSYISLTEHLQKATAVTRLDINQAWGLLTHCGFLSNPRAELQRRLCPDCLVNYLVLSRVSLQKQPCPICSINSNSNRLTDLRAERGRRRKRAD